jgi:tetratricopeptide (TPR) repeat protein
MNLAILHRQQGNFDLAREEYKRSLDRRRPYLEQESASHTALIRDQGMCFYNLAKLEVDDGRTHEAGPPLTEAIEIFERCLESTAPSFEIHQKLGHAYWLRGELLYADFDLEGALAACDRSAQILTQLANENPLVKPLRQALGEVELLQAEIYYATQDREQSLAAVTRSIDQLRKLPDKIDARVSLIRALDVRATVLLEQGDEQAARSDLERCVLLHETIPPGRPEEEWLNLQLESAKEILEQLAPANSSPKEI